MLPEGGREDEKEGVRRAPCLTACCTHSRPADIPEGHLRERPAQTLPAAMPVKVHVLPSIKPSTSRCSLLGTLPSSTDPALTV